MPKERKERPRRNRRAEQSAPIETTGQDGMTGTTEMTVASGKDAQSGTGMTETTGQDGTTVRARTVLAMTGGTAMKVKKIAIGISKIPARVAIARKVIKTAREVAVIVQKNKGIVSSRKSIK